MSNQEPVSRMTHAITRQLDSMQQQGRYLMIDAGAPRFLIRPDQQPEIIALEPLNQPRAGLGKVALVGMMTYPEPHLQGNRVLGVVPSLQIPNLFAVDLSVEQLRQITEITGVPYTFPDEVR